MKIIIYYIVILFNLQLLINYTIKHHKYKGYNKVKKLEKKLIKNISNYA